MSKVKTLPIFNKFLPFTLVVTPIILLIVFFGLSALFLELADTFSTGAKSSGQQFAQTIADILANITAAIFIFLIPFGSLCGVGLLIVRVIRSKRS